MDYYEARRIRKQGFTSLLARKLAEGDKGIFSSIGATLSERQKARMTGLKEKFDPLNIAKFLTGGSKLGPAILGNLLGRTKSDISYFTGQRPTSTKINRLESDDSGLSDILSKMLTYMKNVNEENQKNKQKENNFKEELELERLKRHKELIAALTNRQYEGTATAVKIEQQGQSLFDMITDLFGVAGGAITAFKWLGRLGGFLASPLALGGLTVVGIAYAMYKMLSDPSGYDNDPDSDFNRSLRATQRVGGIAGVREMMEKREKLPEYERTMEDIKDFQRLNNPEFVVRPPSQQDRSSIEFGTTPPAVESAPASGQQLERSQADNLNLKVQDKVSQQQDVVNTRRIDNAVSEQVPTPKNLPAVRNLEPTFESMILDNTRTI